MATKAKTKTAAKAQPQIGIQEIVEATLDAGRGFVYLPESVYAPLVEQGLVEANTGMQNPDNANEYAVRATEKGKQSIMSNEGQTNAPATSKGNFEVAKGFSALGIVSKRRSGGAGTTYPFDTMEVDEYFFIPATAERPNPAKSMASTVSSATARYAKPAADGATRVNRKGQTVPVMVETRKFAVKSAEKDGVAGAYVVRVA